MQKNKKPTNLYKEKENLSPQNIITTNPIDKSNNLVAKINILGSGINSGKIPHGIINHHNEKSLGVIDYAAFIKQISEIIKNHRDIKDSLNFFHSIFINKFSCVCTGLGIINEESGVINIKILDKISNVYSFKVFMSDKNNEIIKAIENCECSVLNGSDFLKLPSITNAPTAVIPVQIQGKNICVAIVSDYNLQNYLNLYQFAAANLGLLIQNSILNEQAAQSSYTDNLTNLYTHRRFHELLTQELVYAQTSKTKVSVLIFDINDMGQINRDYGHSKGDEVIKVVANKINENIKKQDIAARYGGDKIAVILRNMSSEEAKYMAEYLTYSLSCCLVDDIGPVNKVSVGIATYPDDSKDKEKLLILAEQAVLVSKTKGYANGRSTIVTTQDYDFWDDAALNSFATVMAKRHSQLGINFEEALVEQFQNENILSQNHLIEVVTSLASAIDAKDEYTKDHSSSVSRYSVALARAINLPEKEVERIKLGALLHDVGKIGIPEDVLTKPDKLTDDEFKIIQQHPSIGVEKILEPNPLLHDLIPIVKYHHEKWNGKGYPCGLKEEEIPLAARIVAIADTYHALISDRPYRKGLSVETACSILEEGAGIQWDKELVRQFIAIAPSLATKI
ncbi:MAG: diguanylate cyclase [Candidatus Gastranaerophilales bacterium]|nr:diguanylate cyclase [Candidatus Gastranaerophilales bacterium]